MIDIMSLYTTGTKLWAPFVSVRFHGEYLEDAVLGVERRPEPVQSGSFHADAYVWATKIDRSLTDVAADSSLQAWTGKALCPGRFR